MSRQCCCIKDTSKFSCTTWHKFLSQNPKFLFIHLLFSSSLSLSPPWSLRSPTYNVLPFPSPLLLSQVFSFSLITSISTNSFFAYLFDPVFLTNFLVFWILHRFPGLAQSQNDDSQLLSPAECYTCSTQVGIPFFHSTSCDGAHQPEWQASAGSSLMPIQARTGSRGNSPNRVNHLGLFGPVLDPRSGSVLNWNRVLLLARGIALAVDPMFFYCFSLYVGRGGAPCVYLDAELALVVTVLRTCVDAVHLCHLWLQFRLAYVSRESLVVGCGKLVWDARAIACHYVRSLTGFWLDVFVILPIPQVSIQ